MTDLFLLAAEPSADLQGAALIEELLKLNPALQIAAVAGPRMRALPIQCIAPMESLQVMGFVDVVIALPKIIRMFYTLRKQILALSPKAFVAIDYPGFNLRMHRALNRKKYPGKLIHYICPTVWAWGKRRIPLMARNLDLLLTTLPFEPACFAKTPLRAEYIGHPLTEKISLFQPDLTFRTRFGLSPTDKILALFPGSRAQEVDRNLSSMLETAKKLQAKDPHLRIVISSAHESTATSAASYLTIPVQNTYDLMLNTHLALAKSGTVVLELALHRIPTVVQYAIRPFDVFLATKVFKIHLPYYSIANLLLQKEVFPELFGPRLTPESLYGQAEKLWFDEEKRNYCKTLCNEVWETLGTLSASRTAAEKIVELISG